MEITPQEKLLKLKVELLEKNIKNLSNLITDFNSQAQEVDRILTKCRKNSPTENQFEISNDDFKKIISFLTQAVSKDLCHANSKEYIKDYAKEITLNNSILKSLA